MSVNFHYLKAKKLRVLKWVISLIMMTITITTTITIIDLTLFNYNFKFKYKFQTSILFVFSILRQRGGGSWADDISNYIVRIFFERDSNWQVIVDA